jgi:DNA-binding response OmpR family regulator
MEWTIYRDLFGGWRWECHDANGNARDSQQSYDTREDCVAAAARARVSMGDMGKRDAHEGRATAQKILAVTKSVLCVQPNQEQQQLLREALESLHTVFVPTAFEALRCLNSSAFDAHLLNYWLPDWSGIHMCREIRRIDPHAPICFYAAAGTEEQRKRAFKAGADGFLCAPCGPDVLLGEIRTLIHAAELQGAPAQADAEHAIRVELERRVVVAIAQSSEGRRLAQEATERAAKTRAQKAFVAAGGTRAGFERGWGTMFARISADLRPSESAPPAQALGHE